MRVTREFRFEAAHNLIEYKGKCERLHGHSYVLHVTLEAPVRPDGLAFDFVELRRIVEAKVIRPLDHTYLNDTMRQPSAENIAIWVWEHLTELPLAEVTVFETPTSWVTYRGPDAEPR
jgi:6-pyruvoyltetrahydropterin/6-carboxytetrahydropterin synthase